MANLSQVSEQSLIVMSRVVCSGFGMGFIWSDLSELWENYKKYQAELAEKELLVLTSKKNRLEAALADLDNEIKEIQTTHNLLPATTEVPN